MSVVRLSVVRLSVVRLSVIRLSVVRLGGVRPIVVAPKKFHDLNSRNRQPSGSTLSGKLTFFAQNDKISCSFFIFLIKNNLDY